MHFITHFIARDMASVGGGKTKYIYRYDKIVYNSVHVAVASQQRVNNFVFPWYKHIYYAISNHRKAGWMFNWITQNTKKVVSCLLCPAVPPVLFPF